MKLIKQTHLLCQDDRSDKVYEVDLCQVGEDRYVVNFRYGRRGTHLKEGTKTTTPTNLTAATTIFDQLVTSKIKKGYQETPAPASLPSSSPAPAPLPGISLEKIEDPRHRAIVQRLAGQGNPKWSLERAIWRAGELQVKAATPLLLSLLGAGTPRQDYSIVAALGWCGDADTIPPLQTLYQNPQTPDFVKRIAWEAIYKLSDPSQRQLEQTKLMAQLPAPLQPFTPEALATYLDTTDPSHFQILEQLYQIDTPPLRAALLEQLRHLPLKPPAFKPLRHIFKQAEYRQDAEVFGILAYRWETTRAFYKRNRYGVYHPEIGYLSSQRVRYNYQTRQRETLEVSYLEREITAANSRLAFSEDTRDYLRRRVWRTLAKLGENNDPQYVDLAIGILQQYRDSDAQTPKETTFSRWQRTEREGYHWQQVTYRRWRGTYTDYFVFHQILYGKSSRYLFYRNLLQWRCRQAYQPGEPAPGVREEFFPQLWSQFPEKVLQLLLISSCHPVHQFGVKVLRECSEFAGTLDLNSILLLLKKPYVETAQLAFEWAVNHYNPRHPNFDLVLECATCLFPPAREQAYQWMTAQPHLFLENPDFLVSLITGTLPETLELNQNFLQLTSITSTTAKVVIAQVIAHLLSLSETENERAHRITTLLLTGCTFQLRYLGLSVIYDLLQHQLPALPELGARILLNHETPADQLPTNLIISLLESPNSAVRQVGVEIFAQLPDHILIQEQRSLILAMAVSTDAQMRQGVKPIIQRLAGVYGEFALPLAREFMEILRVPESYPGVHNDIVELLKTDIPGWQAQVSKEIALELLRTRSSAAQELSGLILQHHYQHWAPEFSTLEIVKLANHEIASVRIGSRQLFQANLERFRQNTSEMMTAVKLLEAKWEDSRQFAWEIFSQSFRDEEWVPEVMISICDSVKEDVRQFGRELVTRTFQASYGGEYLLKFSEHPSVDIQTFATHYLETYAANNLERLQQLIPYFSTLLYQVNKGRVAKTRVLAFLEREAEKSLGAAEIVAEILRNHVDTILIADQGKILQILLKIYQKYPQISLPIQVKPVVEVR